MLIVDDVFRHRVDHRRGDRSSARKGPARTRQHDIRVAVPYYKPARSRTSRVPDYYLHETASWLKYPHSLEGLSVEEVAANRPELYAIIKDQLGQQD